MPVCPRPRSWLLNFFIALSCLAHSMPVRADLNEAKEYLLWHNYKSALVELAPLIQAGDAEALYLQASLYEYGKGVPRDFAQAALLYRQAADQGFAPAQGALGVMYSAGLGVPKDEERAYFWYLLAIAGGDEYAIKYRDHAGQFLSQEKRTNAEAAARNWKQRQTTTPTNEGVKTDLQTTAAPRP